MHILLFLLLIQDSASALMPAAQHHDINLPAPPIGGTKNDWIGYGISVASTLAIGLITRFFEHRKMKRNFQRKLEELK